MRREDVRGFREALRNSAALAGTLEEAAAVLRTVHTRYATRGAAREHVYDDAGGLGLTLAHYQEMVWEAGLIGRQLSRNLAKSAFVNSLNAGDALAGLTEFVEVVVRLAHHLTPMTREERVGAPPPPSKKGGMPPAAPPLPPPLLEHAADGETLVFVPHREKALVGKLQYVLGRLATVAQSAEDAAAAAEAILPRPAANKFAAAPPRTDAGAQRPRGKEGRAGVGSGKKPPGRGSGASPSQAARASRGQSQGAWTQQL